MKSISLKWGAALVALNTLLGSATYASAADSKPLFTDLTQVQQAKSAAILEAARQGLLGGDPNGQFRPASSLTRQELAAILTKALKLDTSFGSASTFNDVQSAHWSNAAIEAVKKAGIMTGDAQGLFNPNRPVTREELATIFVRAINGVGARGGQSNLPADQSSISTWAKDSIAVALQLKLIDTTGDQFNPKGSVQRQDIADFVLNIFKKEQQTAAIDSVEGDFVTINGVPYLIEGKLKELIGDTNRDALKGAVLKFNSLNRNIDGLQELEIVRSGAQLNTAGLPAQTLLSVAASGVKIRGDVPGELKIKEGVASVDLQGTIGQVTVNTATPVAISGSGSVQNLTVIQGGAKITLDPSLSILTLHLPDNSLPSQIITNYAAIQDHIKQIQNASGNAVQTPKPTPAPNYISPAVNHNPVAKGIEIGPLQENGQSISLDLNDFFTDEDNDVLSYSASSSAAAVASASVAGSKLTLLSAAAGTTVITVSAADGRGGTATLSFNVTVEAAPKQQHAPIVINRIADVSALVDSGVQSVNLQGVFSDPDGDALSFSAVSSDPAVATVAVYGSELSVTPVSAGITTITVTADDGKDGTVQTAFIAKFSPLEVPEPVNHAPVVIHNINDISKSVTDGLQTIDLAGVFSDSDGDALTYTAVSSDQGVATVSLSSSSLFIAPVDAGATTITVTANDGKGGNQSTSFVVTLSQPAVNHAPVVDHEISPVTLSFLEGARTIDLNTVFSDPDGDTLIYSAISSNPLAAVVAVNGNVLSITPGMPIGTSSIIVTAIDSKGGIQSTSFLVTILPLPVNHAPAVLNGINDISKSVTDGLQTIDLTGVFSDSDGDALTYSVVSSDQGVATVSVSGSSLSITPVNAGTTTVTVIANDGKGGTAQTTLTASFTAAIPKNIFFSELVYGSEFLQALELYNPTNQVIDGSKLRIERSDGREPIVLNGANIPSKQAFVIMESFYEGEVASDYFSTMLFFSDDSSPVTLSLYYNDVLIDVGVLVPHHSLSRTPGAMIGSTLYNPQDWLDEGLDYTAGLGNYDVD